MVTVPVLTAVQINNWPCGGGDGVGSPARIPGGVTVTPPHCWPGEVRVSSTDWPTRRSKVWPLSAAVTCTTIDVSPVVGVVLVTTVVAGPDVGVVRAGADTGVVVTGPELAVAVVVTGLETGVVVSGADPEFGAVVAGPTMEEFGNDGAGVVGEPAPAAMAEVLVVAPALTETLEPPEQPATSTTVPAATIPRRWRTPIR
jgi:hypothetical protein